MDNKRSVDLTDMRLTVNGHTIHSNRRDQVSIYLLLIILLILIEV